jgi:hypothetical protein
VATTAITRYYDTIKHPAFTGRVNVLSGLSAWAGKGIKR